MDDTKTRPVVVVVLVSNLEFGGAQRQLIELANHIGCENIQLHICSLSDYVPMGTLLDDRDSRLHIVAKRHKYDIGVVPRIARLLQRLNADVVHGYLFDAEIAARLAGRLAGVSAIGNCERNTNYDFKRVQLLAYFLTRRFVTFYIANSNAGARFNQASLGNSTDLYFTIHNGVDTERFRPMDPSRARAELGIGDHHFVVGMFGSFKEQKNHPLLFRAARHLIERHPDTRILIVGDELAGGLHGSTDYKRRVMQLVDDLDIRDYFVFSANSISVEQLYPACDVTALPSLFEGTPNVALESMACCVPVVASNVSDNAYVIRDGETGFVVDLHDETAFAERLLRLAGDPTLRKTLGQNARQWMIDEFSCACLARRTAVVYQHAIGRTSPEADKLRSFQELPASPS